MREIKFRAWHVSSKTLMQDVQQNTNFGFLLDNPDHFKIMQFTGLLDKNGKEIYEGDIIKCFDGEIGEIRFELPFCVYGIQSRMRFRSFENVFIAWYEQQHCFGGTIQPLLEVIGNIYENPELLK